jgi:hypothetical protein
MAPGHHPAFPESTIVKAIARVRDCGSMVCDNDMTRHEKSCVTCMDDFKRIVCDQIRRLKQILVKVQARNVLYERARKRKIDDESRFERENVELRKQLHVIRERDRRARRRMNKKI